MKVLEVLKRKTGYFIGVFALAGFFTAGGLGLGNFGTFAPDGYKVMAVFDDVGGLESGDNVSVAGVKVGRVESVTLKGCEAVVVLNIKDGVDVYDDAVASIKTKSLLGGKYIQICPGSSDNRVSEGGKIRETESAMDPERLISNYVFGKV